MKEFQLTIQFSDEIQPENYSVDDAVAAANRAMDPMGPVRVAAPIHEFQTRSEESGTIQHSSLSHAFNAAEDDEHIWKISFDANSGERVRLVRRDARTFPDDPPFYIWVYEDILSGFADMKTDPDATN